MPEKRDSDIVEIKLPKHGDDVAPGRCTRSQFEEVWKPLGWKIVGEILQPETVDDVTAKAAKTKPGGN